ncbi:MAG: tryptophan synthase subunit alpha [Methanomassiliicoccus sp.]|nr:tryptophan synthase subunit alpha [Methanomassiliicoccus sp.]
MAHIREALAGGRKLICFITAGYPSPSLSIAHALACVEGGADVIELGVPFSDPVADGKVIQFTSQKALEGGMTPRKVFDLVREIRESSDVPIVLMGYYNPIFQIGEESYVQLSAESGVDGLIVPDLPCEESRSLAEHCRARGLDLVQLVGPTTSAPRMAKIAAASSGFLYVVSALGTTGTRSSFSDGVGEVIRRAKGSAGDLPLGVGFGISRREHAEAMYREGADAAIVGSAILQGIIDGASPDDTRKFVHDLKAKG